MRVQCQLLLRPSPPKACPNICYLSKYNFGNWKIFTTACQNMILVVTKINLSKIVYKKLPPMACPNPSFWMMHLKVCFGIFDRSKQTITGFFSWDLSNTSNAFSPFFFWLFGTSTSTDYLIIWLFDYWVQDQVLTVRRSCQRPSSVSTSISSSFAPFIALEEEAIYPENILFSPRESNFPLHYPEINLHFSEIIFFFLLKNWNVPLIALEYPSLLWNKPSFFLGYFFPSFSKETSIAPFIALQYKKGQFSST